MAKRYVLTDKLGNEILSSNSFLGYIASLVITTLLSCVGMIIFGGIACAICNLFSFLFS